MISTGIKTSESDKRVTELFVNDHLTIGINSLREIINHSSSVKHLKF
jgi:AMP nucleosidase